MTENKQFYYMAGVIFDNTKDKKEWGIPLYDLDKGLMIVDLLNTQCERITELESRNNRQYESLKELTDFIIKRDWKSLESIVEDWKKTEQLLEREHSWCLNDD